MPVTRDEVRDGMRVTWQAAVEMDDGLVLRADVFRPLAERPCPVLLSYGPYGKGLSFQEGYAPQWEKLVADHPDVARGSSNRYQNWEVVDPERWVPHGYACVRVDSRGTGWSPGTVDPFSPREADDLAACIEWAAAQPWCSGKVGLIGISYYAINQWQVAGRRPAHLAAMVPWEGCTDMYRDQTHHGGILCDFQANWFDRQVRTVQYGLGSRSATNPLTGEAVGGPEDLSEDELAARRLDLGAELRARPLDGPWYRERSADLDGIDVPFLSAANWGGQGLHTRGNFEAFARAPSPRKWLEVHGGEHWTSFYTDEGIALQRRFLDHFLHGADNGWESSPRVRLQVRHPGERFVPRSEHEWPLARTEWTTYHLDGAAGTLRTERPDTAATAPFEALGDGLDFALPVVDEPVEITGPLAARLFVSSSTDDADLFLVLRCFAPSGEEVTFQGALDPNTPIAQGWLRASHRRLDAERSLPYRPYHTHDVEELLQPGQVVELHVELWPTCLVVPPRYRVVLSVRGCDYEYRGPTGEFADRFYYAGRGVGPFTHTADRGGPRFAGVTTLHTGPAHPSSLLVPVVPPAAG